MDSDRNFDKESDVTNNQLIRHSMPEANACIAPAIMSEYFISFSVDVFFCIRTLCDVATSSARRSMELNGV